MPLRGKGTQKAVCARACVCVCDTENVLNVENAVAAEVVTGVVDNGDIDMPDVTREEVAKAVRTLQNGKAAGEDRIVAELLKGRGEAVIDWLTELMQEVWRTRKVKSQPSIRLLLHCNCTHGSILFKWL